MQFLVQAHGPDRPGMVASVTNALAAIGCNLEDASMTRLSGHFTMLMSTTADASENDLFDALRGIGSDIQWSVSPLQKQVIKSGPRWTITIWGEDKVGIVAAFAGCLAEKQANIVDLSAHRTGPDDAPIYTVLIEVSVEQDAGNAMALALENLASEIGVTCHAVPVEVDTL